MYIGISRLFFYPRHPLRSSRPLADAPYVHPYTVQRGVGGSDPNVRDDFLTWAQHYCNKGLPRSSGGTSASPRLICQTHAPYARAPAEPMPDGDRLWHDPEQTSTFASLYCLVVCVQVWLVATSTLRLRTPRETPGSVTRDSIVSDAARGVPQVALIPLAIR